MVHRRDVPAEIVHETCGFLDQLAVALRHLSFLDVKVVLQADARVATHRDGRRDQCPLVEPDADDLPVRFGRQRVDLVGQVTSGARNPAEDLTSFLKTTYESAAGLAGWSRTELERR